MPPVLQTNLFRLWCIFNSIKIKRCSRNNNIIHIMNCAKIQTKSSLLYTEFSPYICLAGMNPRKCIYTSRLLTPCMKRIRLDSLTASYGDNNNSNSALLVYSSYWKSRPESVGRWSKGRWSAKKAKRCCRLLPQRWGRMERAFPAAFCCTEENVKKVRHCRISVDQQVAEWYFRWDFTGTVATRGDSCSKSCKNNPIEDTNGAHSRATLGNIIRYTVQLSVDPSWAYMDPNDHTECMDCNARWWLLSLSTLGDCNSPCPSATSYRTLDGRCVHCW